MTSRQTQAWFLVRYLRGQGLIVEAGDTAVNISQWSAQKPREIDREVLESVRCLKDEMLLILRLEQRVTLDRRRDRASRQRRKKWTYKRGSK
jgi:hypothetical protein